MWDTLSEIWQACLEEAWGAFISGSVPIGAIITDNKGVMVARGRNRVFDLYGPAKNIFNSPLAHAEINAILNLDNAKVEPKTSVLYTTMEPCPLCVGAIAMAGIQNLVYATPEPHAGGVSLLNESEYLKQKSVKVIKEERSDLAAINYLIVAEFYFTLNNDQTKRVLNEWKKTIPSLLKQSEMLHRSGLLSKMKKNHDPIMKVVNLLSDKYLDC